MNAAFKAASGELTITKSVNTDVIPASALPGTLMLIILVVFAVLVSLLAEFFYGYVRDLRDASWVRPSVREHYTIVRATGNVAFKSIKDSERQMNEVFKVASDRPC
ncbi:hypothetical protein [Rhizobium tibeticum]|uniref:hypothetical protein n=1 Tax=Rhizobium tibeticum TaxID=501024 RepID=UPI000A5B23E4|nr:hypothetical protein [Rhizobium tibeticum]